MKIYHLIHHLYSDYLLCTEILCFLSNHILLTRVHLKTDTQNECSFKKDLNGKGRYKIYFLIANHVYIFSQHESYILIHYAKEKMSKTCFFSR